MGNVRVVPNDDAGTGEAGYRMPAQVKEMGAYITSLIDFGIVSAPVGMELLSRLASVAECGFDDCITAIGYAMSGIQEALDTTADYLPNMENVPDLATVVRERDPLPDSHTS